MAYTCPNCRAQQAVAILTFGNGHRRSYPCLNCGFSNFKFRTNPAPPEEDGMGIFGRHRGMQGDDHDEDYHLHECPEAGCQGSIGFKDITDKFGNWIGQDVMPCNKCGYNGKTS